MVISTIALAKIAFGLNYLVGIPSTIAHTERFFDLTGCGGFVLMTILSWYHSERNLRQTILSAFVLIWAARLGYFLFCRVQRDNEDKRFRGIRDSFFMFLGVWTMQSFWNIFNPLPVYLLNQHTHGKQGIEITWQDLAGWTCWILGFALEVVADREKYVWTENPATKGRFIHTGTWSWSRHPNYFGEILLWIGISLSASSELSGLELLSLLTSVPMTISILFAPRNGVPYLERKAEEKWGDNPSYQAYKRTTPVLIPSIGKIRASLF